MKLILHGKKLGDLQSMEASALVVCLDNGTPVAVVADMAGNVALRTARDKGFEHTLKTLGFGLDAPEIKEVEIPVGEPG